MVVVLDWFTAHLSPTQPDLSAYSNAVRQAVSAAIRGFATDDLTGYPVFVLDELRRAYTPRAYDEPFCAAQRFEMQAVLDWFKQRV